MSVQKYTFVENQNKIQNTFWPDFYYFHEDFCHSKNVDVYSLSFLRGLGSQNTYENVDIYGRPLMYN